MCTLDLSVELRNGMYVCGLLRLARDVREPWRGGPALQPRDRQEEPHLHHLGPLRHHAHRNNHIRNFFFK